MCVECPLKCVLWNEICIRVTTRVGMCTVPWLLSVCCVRPNECYTRFGWFIVSSNHRQACNGPWISKQVHWKEKPKIWEYRVHACMSRNSTGATNKDVIITYYMYHNDTPKILTMIYICRHTKTLFSNKRKVAELRHQSEIICKCSMTFIHNNLLSRLYLCIQNLHLGPWIQIS